MFIKDGTVFNQIYRGRLTDDEMYRKISDTLTVLHTEREREPENGRTEGEES